MISHKFTNAFFNIRHEVFNEPLLILVTTRHQRTLKYLSWAGYLRHQSTQDPLCVVPYCVIHSCSHIYSHPLGNKCAVLHSSADAVLTASTESAYFTFCWWPCVILLSCLKIQLTPHLLSTFFHNRKCDSYVFVVTCINVNHQAVATAKTGYQHFSKNSG